jgi:WD40 repeat protein
VVAIRCFEGFSAWVGSVAFSPKAFHALSGNSDGLVQLWDVGTGDELRELTGHTDIVRSVSFSPGGRYAISASGGRWKDGGRIITAGSDYNLRLWDLESGKEVWCLGGHTAPIYGAAFSPDGKRILSCGVDSHFNNWLSGVVDNSIRLWDTKTGKPVRRLKGHTHGVRSVAFSPDGRYAVSGSADKSVRLWDLASGQEVRSFLGHEQDVQSVQVSPDGKYVLSGSCDRTIRLWHFESGKEVQRFSGHDDEVCAVAFCPDGRHVVSGSADDTGRLWAVETGCEVCRLIGHADGVLTVAVCRDGQHVLSGSMDNTMRLWKLPI